MVEANLKQIGKYVVNLSEKLGSGSFGDVYAGFNSEEPEKKLAVKILNMDRLAESEHHEENQKMLKREIKILKSLKSDYIAQMYDIIRTARNLYMFLRYAADGDLAQYLKKQKNRRVDEAQAMKFTAQIVEGYKALHKKQIIHRDIKPANILLDNGVALIADFGLGKITDANADQQQKMTVQGTPFYRSPQLLVENSSHTIATNKCDLWSLGTMLYEMINGCRPWDAGDITSYDKQIRSKPLVFHTEVSEPVKNLIIGMLQIEEKDRLSWEQVFVHPAIKGVKLQ